MWDLLGCYRDSRALLGGNAPEDNGSGSLDDFQALLQEFRVSMPELDVVERQPLGRRDTFPSNSR